ncbi:MAG TPA: ABC transporter permease [Gemmatimonadaceae bacterium]|nr:ABC transporter permease [Gemmatimonadaceae bacterium]
MDTFINDIRYAARKLLRAPGFTFIAVATLALAIGATTAVFSIVNGVLLKPLPFRDPDGVVKVGTTGKDGKLVHMSAPDFVDYRDQTHSFVGMAQVWDRNSANLSVAGAEPVRLNSAAVGARFFELLGLRMPLGRGFLTGEDAIGARHVVVLSDHLWRSTFSADPNVVGRSVSLNGEDYTIVGVAPASLTYPSKPDVWVPFVFETWMTAPDNRGAHFISAIARIRPGMSLEAAKRDIAAIGERLRKEYPRSNANFGATIETLQTSLVGDVKPLLWTMFGAVVFVLLIACANVANLLLVRAAGRETEMAVRTALGAGRRRIVQQLVTESVLLALVGAALGAALAAWAVDAVVAFGPRGLPRIDDIVVDSRVLGFSVLLAMVTGVAFGLVPALHAARGEIGQLLKEGVRGTSSRRATRGTRSVLVVGEMALALVLLVGSGLLIRSFANLLRVNPGFRPEQVVSFDVSLPSVKYPHDREIRAFAASVRERLSALPGTRAVAVAFARPMEQQTMRTAFDIEGRPPAPMDNRLLTDVRPASANFFSTIGIPVVRGRVFASAEENFGPPPVLVVSQAFAKKYFPNEDPIGKRIKLGVAHDTAAEGTQVVSRGEIVGVVGDVRQKGLADEIYPAVYLGWGTFPINDIALLVRSDADVGMISAAIREQVHAVDPTMPVYDVHTMTDAVSESVAQPRFYTTLLTAFGALALLLAVLGIYGVISYSVSQRTRELGIRIALGASHDRVLRLVLGQGLTLTVTGVIIGLIGAFWLTRLLSALLFGIQPTDAITFGGVAVVMLGVASLASYLPARRAARVDPVIAMRAE